jgi:multimeric flavodoxin WrbA
MKVLLLNGSPKQNGNTFIALNEVSKSLEAEGVDTEIIHVGAKSIRGCLACGQCNNLKECVTNDLVNETLAKFKEADGLVVGSPVYYASPAGTLISFLDRLFFASKFDKTMKVGASVAVARRGGTTATFDVLNKYFTISNMPIVSSSYWNNVHGAAPGEAKEDAEGLQTMRRLGKNMAFLIKAIRLAKDVMPLPALDEQRQVTSFIR